MEVEDVAGERLAARRAAQQQRELAVGDGLLREVVVDAERVPAVVAEVLAHGHARVRGDELKRGHLRGAGDDDGRVLHRPVVLEAREHVGDRRLLLADGDVDAVHVLALLVDDRVDGDGGLARLAVADDELALAAADRDHRVDGLEAGLERLGDRLASHDARGLDLDAPGDVRLDGALAVHGLAERVDHASDERRPHRHLDDAPGPLDGVALLDRPVGAEDGDADAVLLEVQHHAHQVSRELDQLAGHRVLEAVDAGDAVTDRQDRPGLDDVDLLVVAGDLLLDDLRDLFCAELHFRGFLLVGGRGFFSARGADPAAPRDASSGFRRGRGHPCG